MARSDFRYTQLVIGDCGHVCNQWPEFSESLEGRNPKVICDKCVKLVFAIDDGVPLFHYTNFRRVPSEFGYQVVAEPLSGPPKKRAARKKSPPRKRTPKPKKGMALILEQEGIF